MLSLTDQRWAQLVDVNARVNALPYVADLARYHTSEFWAEIDQGGGDCEDFAIGKRAELLTFGWPPEALRLAICRTETGEGHAVLTVDTDRGTFVLDNRFPRPERWGDLVVRGYVWNRRQRAGGTGWVAIGGFGA